MSDHGGSARPQPLADGTLAIRSQTRRPDLSVSPNLSKKNADTRERSASRNQFRHSAGTAAGNLCPGDVCPARRDTLLDPAQVSPAPIRGA